MPFEAEQKHVCHILVEGIKRNNSVKLFWSWTRGSGGYVFWKISYLELLRPSSSVERNNLSNFERGYHGEHSCEVIWNLDQWFRRCRLKDFFFWALAALLFSGAEPFMQFWKRASWGIFMWSYVKFGPVVQEEMLFKEKVFGRGMHCGRRTKTDHNTSPWAFSSGELIKGCILKDMTLF